MWGLAKTDGKMVRNSLNDSLLNEKQICKLAHWRDPLTPKSTERLRGGGRVEQWGGEAMPP